MTDTFNAIVALCKRRGFVYPGSEIYGPIVLGVIILAIALRLLIK